MIAASLMIKLNSLGPQKRELDAIVLDVALGGSLIIAAMRWIAVFISSLWARIEVPKIIEVSQLSKNIELSPRLRVQIKLALAGNWKSGTMSDELVREAKSIGLTDAEIDAAWSGRSFEAKTCAAVRLAQAHQPGQSGDLAAARAHAAEFGLCPVEIKQIEELADVLIGQWRDNQPYR